VIKVLDATFVKSGTSKAHWPRESLPEVAFAGRSNVGKSSMINTLTRRRKLVRVSNTPGRTRTLNFFDATLETRAKKRVIRLCDLPGYGYAKVSKTAREDWREMISEYVAGRPQLKVVVSIIDAEVGATEDDEALLDFLKDQPPKILVVATKIDRLNKAARKPKVLSLAKTLGLPLAAVVGFSSTEGTGVEEVWGTLLAAIGSGG
jgi:GTP-binding protein